MFGDAGENTCIGCKFRVPRTLANRQTKQVSNQTDPPFELIPVRAFAPSFGPVPTESVFKKMRQQIFIKVREDTNLGGAKAAALPLRPPPGVEAKVSIVKGSAKEG